MTETPITPTADGIPMRPATWRSWGADERLIWLELQEAGQLAEASRKQIVAAVGEHGPAVRKLLDDHEQRVFDEHQGEIRLLVARLKRYLPQYEDLLEWAYGIGIDYNEVFKPFYELKSDNA